MNMKFANFNFGGLQSSGGRAAADSGPNLKSGCLCLVYN